MTMRHASASILYLLAVAFSSGASAQQDPGPQSNNPDLSAFQQRIEQLASNVERAEAVRAVKRVQHAYSHYFTAGRWSDVADLFANGGITREGDAVVTGRANLRRHFTKRFGEGEVGLAEGRLHSTVFLSPVVTLDPDGKTARGRWHALSMTGTYGSTAAWAGGIYENEYVNEGGTWKIRNEHYYPQYAGPYEGGWHNITREKGKPAPVPFHYDPTRAGIPVPPAVAPSNVSPKSFAVLAARLAELHQRVNNLNDSSAVQNLQHAYGFYVDRKMWDDVADLFTTDGTMELGRQGVYVGRTSIRRALNQYGPQGLRENEVNDHLQLQTIVSITPDGRTAKARGAQVRMTGVNGKGAQWGLDVFENSYVKDNGVWRIQAMRIYPRMTTDYYQGWARSAEPAPGPSAEFPPDQPSSVAYESYPKSHVVAFHYQHPGKRRAADRITPAKELRPRTLGELEAVLTSAERGLAVAEAHDGAENVANAYGYYIDEFLWDDTANLFSLDGWKELSYIGTYVGRERVRQSMIKRYGTGGRRANSLAIHQKTQPVVHVSSDGQSARIRTRLFQLNSSIDGEGSYIAGIYENAVVKENGVWKISAMDLDYTWTTRYTTGWAKVSGSDDSRRFAPQQPALAKEFPPDRPLRGVVYAPFPKIAETGFHYRNPVSGRAPPLLLE